MYKYDKNMLSPKWEWMGMGVAGIMIDSYCVSFPHSLLRTSKFMISHDFPATYGDPF
jgi:hypothetical protein